MQSRYYASDREINKYTRAVSRQRFCKHVPAATDTHAKIEVLLETGVCMVVRTEEFKEDNWGSQVSSVWESVKKRIQLEESLRSERT
jgi:hypothetical protein